MKLESTYCRRCRCVNSFFFIHNVQKCFFSSVSISLSIQYLDDWNRNSIEPFVFSIYFCWIVDHGFFIITFVHTNIYMQQTSSSIWLEFANCSHFFVSVGIRWTHVLFFSKTRDTNIALWLFQSIEFPLIFGRAIFECFWHLQIRNHAHQPLLSN